MQQYKMSERIPESIGALTLTVFWFTRLGISHRLPSYSLCESVSQWIGIWIAAAIFIVFFWSTTLAASYCVAELICDGLRSLMKRRAMFRMTFSRGSISFLALVLLGGVSVYCFYVDGQRAHNLVFWAVTYLLACLVYEMTRESLKDDMQKIGLI